MYIVVNLHNMKWFLSITTTDVRQITHKMPKSKKVKKKKMLALNSRFRKLPKALDYLIQPRINAFSNCLQILKIAEDDRHVGL